MRKKKDEYFVPVAEQRARQEQEAGRRRQGRWAHGCWVSRARGAGRADAGRASARRAGAGRAGIRALGVRRAARHGRAGRVGGRWCAGGSWGAGKGARGSLHGRWARGLGEAWACCWASRLCTRCTQLVLTQFRLSTIPESIFGEIFFRKKINK